MFGFMKPRVQTLDYRSVYSRCCQHQRLHYGLLSLPFHSYEAVFLYLCALDAGLFPETVVRPQKCCQFRRAKDLLTSPDAAVGQFCASLGVLLTDIKLQDDIRDHSSVLARLYHWVLREPIARAADYFQSLDPDFDPTVRCFLGEHLALEKNESSEDLRSFLLPTAEAFAYVFGLLSKVQTRTGFEEFFPAAGFHLGAAVIAFDCATDWKDDLRNGSPNPVKDAAGAGDAARVCTRELAALADRCHAAFGPDSRSGELASSVQQAVAETFGIPPEPALTPASTQGIHRTKTRESVVLYANCSVPVDHGSGGCCGIGRRAPTYVNLNEKESGCYVCCSCVGSVAAIIAMFVCCQSANKGPCQ